MVWLCSYHSAFSNPVATTSTDLNWINVMCTTVKVTKCKLGPFEDAQSMSKWPAGSDYIGSIINYLTYLPDPFPKGIEVYVEGSSTFPILILSMHIIGLGLFNYLYRYLFNCIAMWQGSWDSATGIHMKVR